MLMRMKTFRYPTLDEVRALERRARHMRQQEIWRLICAGIALVRRRVRAPSRKGAPRLARP